MRFEWDPGKNAANIRDHGIALADAIRIFDGPTLERIDQRLDYGEERIIGIGLVENRVVTVVFTEPNQDLIRMISARKATTHEREAFAQYLGER